MNKTLIIIPILIYLIAMLLIAYRVNKIKNNSKNFTNEYYLDSRSIGGNLSGLSGAEKAI